MKNVRKKKKFSLKNNKIIIINRLLDQDNQTPKIQTKPGTKRKGKMGKKKAKRKKDGSLVSQRWG